MYRPPIHLDIDGLPCAETFSSYFYGSSVISLERKKFLVSIDLKEWEKNNNTKMWHTFE